MLRPTPARPLPRCRGGLLPALRRRPRLWWALVVTLALAVGLTVSSAVERADAARRAWGEPVAVVVATADIGPGDAITDAVVALEERPGAVVPASALTEVPVARSAATSIAAGEVVVAERLADAGLRGPAAMLPPGTRAVAVPAERGLTPPLAAGDRVDVVVALGGDGEDRGGAPPGFTLVDAALVVDVSEDAVTVAVPRADTARVAVALGSGVVTLALVGAR